MPDAADLLFRPVHELAGMVRSGELSARELVQASLERIEALDPQLNAFVDVFADDALAAADGVTGGDDRPLAGVPVAIKNNRAVAGKRLTLGARFMGDFVAPYDHNVTRRLRAAGAIVVGTTTLPEWGILPVSEARRFGEPTRNPWDRDRTPGGSSGGSAAAVASGMVPLAHGNDGGGSTRIPAACCGLVGLKPQRGRISLAPELGEQFLVQDGVLTRTVGETAMLLDLLAGPEPGDASWAPPPPEPYAAAVGRRPERLRVALTTTPPLDAPVDPEHVAAVHRTGELLRDLGHEVEEVEAPWQDEGLLATFTASFGPAQCTQIGLAAMLAGREPTAEDMEPLSWWLWQTCKSIDSVGAQLAAARLQGAARAIIGWTNRWDAIVTPGLAEPPVAHGTIDSTAADAQAAFARSGRFTPFTALFNVTGQPAIALPLFRREDGLPLAVQVVGRPAEEGALLALSAQLEEAAPGVGARAPVS